MEAANHIKLAKRHIEIQKSLDCIKLQIEASEKDYAQLCRAIIQKLLK